MLKGILVLSVFCMALGTSPVWAERPLHTEGAGVLGDGRIDVEIGSELLENNELPFDSSRVGRTQISLPTLGVAFGLGEQVEIQADFDVFYLDEDNRSDDYDTGDLRLWTKIMLLDPDSNLPGVGLRFGVKLPNASNASRLGTDETDFLGHVILSDTFGPIEARANLGIGILGNPNKTSEQDDVFTYGAAVLYPVENSRLTWVAEIVGQAASDDNNDVSGVRAGAIFSLNEDIDVDLSTRAGLTDESEDWGIGAGVTWHFSGSQP